MFSNFLLLGALAGFSQGQETIDSLLKDLTSAANDTARIELYYQLSYNYDMIDPSLGLVYADSSLVLSTELGLQGHIGWAYNGKAINLAEMGRYEDAHKAYRRSRQIFQEHQYNEALASVLCNHGTLFENESMYPDALNCYHQALDHFKKLDRKEKVASVLVNIGNIYAGLEDHQNATSYYQKALGQIERADNPTIIGVLYGNLAISYHELGQDSLAGSYYDDAIAIHDSTGSPGWKALTLGNRASMYYDLGQYDEAALAFSQSLDIYRNLELEAYSCWILTELGMVELERENVGRAIDHCRESLEISQRIGQLDTEMDACECLGEAFDVQGKYKEALDMRRNYDLLKDSVNDLQGHEEIVRIMMNRAFKAQSEVDSLKLEEERLVVEMAHREEVAKKEKSRNMFLGGGVLLLLLAIGLYSRMRYVRNAKNEIEKEKDRSEGLLLNILPRKVADELKEKGSAEAQLIDQVTVLFTDFKGFTALSEKLSPKQLVKDLHECFSAFDRICEKHGLEKIKTIGDAYMAAGGLPTPNDTHATDVIKAALEMRDFVEAGKAKKIEAGLPYFEIRIGVHTGPVVAGIVGVKKFQYDIWGDTVNTASRMESSGEVGQVNISEATYELVKDRSEFEFTSRGKVEAKGKGQMDMYFVSALSSGK